MRVIHIYGEPAEKTLEPEEISSYVRAKLPGAKVALRKEFLLYRLDSKKGKNKNIDYLARELVNCRVGDLNASKKEEKGTPFPVEIEYEKMSLVEPKKRKPGIVYDGFLLQDFFKGLICPGERSINHWHIVFTNRLLATRDGKDNRYHLRIGIYSMPDLISTSGIVEAPAKPKEYYLLKSLGETAIEEWKEKNKERFIDYDDPRLTEVAKGYVLQAIFYHLTGDPFCENKNCRLYNAHWQEELIKAQLNKRGNHLRGNHPKSEFCKSHQQILENLDG